MNKNSALRLCSLIILPLLFLAHCSRKPEPPAPLKEPALSVLDAEPSGKYLLIESKTKQLLVRETGKTLAAFSKAAFGSSGIGIKHKRGDNITPTGRFRVAWIAPSKKFRLFIGLNYPSIEYAEQGIREKLITKKQFEKIKQAALTGKTPPQDTLLGGYLGIHGLGDGPLEIHLAANWTNGCIALDNEQIDALRKFVFVGMPVIIR